ncbi:MAG: hypothetical protein WBN40_09515 [Pseudomonadales bacterium]
MLSLNTLLLRGLPVAATLATLSTTAQAFSVNAYAVDFYNDPNQYLGDLGLGNIVIGQNASVTFSIADFSADVIIPLPAGLKEYLYVDAASTPGLFSIDGNNLPTPNNTSIIIGNNASGLFGFGDYYVYNQFFDSPEPGFTALSWAAVFFDSSATAIDNDNLFELGSTIGWDTKVISAQLWNATTFSAAPLLNATHSVSSSNPVPLPAAGWLFVSVITGFMLPKAKNRL